MVTATQFGTGPPSVNNSCHRYLQATVLFGTHISRKLNYEVEVAAVKAMVLVTASKLPID